MTDLLPLAERLAPRQRPPSSPCGYHRWHDLLFIHWRVPPSILRPLVPSGLDIDTWDGDAWLGVVAFDMTGVRPWWSPAVPGLSAFHETNLRTYVHVAGRGPGVYFISLEAANSLAVRVARWRWNLPYYRAQMTIRREAVRIHYTSERLWPEPRDAFTDLEAELGEPLGEASNESSRHTPCAVVGQAFQPAWQTGMSAPRSRLGETRPRGVIGHGTRSVPTTLGRTASPSYGHAQPDTLEFFLAERYLLYTRSRKGNSLCGQVHHTPYPLRAARLLRCDETLSRAAGICCPERDHPAPCHAMFSGGVEVEIFPLRPVHAACR